MTLRRDAVFDWPLPFLGAALFVFWDFMERVDIVWAPLVRGVGIDARTTQSPAHREASPECFTGWPCPPGGTHSNASFAAEVQTNSKSGDRRPAQYGKAYRSSPELLAGTLFECQAQLKQAGQLGYAGTGCDSTRSRTSSRQREQTVSLFLAGLPLWVAAILLVVLPTIAAMCRPVLMRRQIGLERLASNNDIAGFKFATVG